MKLHPDKAVSDLSPSTPPKSDHRWGCRQLAPPLQFLERENGRSATERSTHFVPAPLEKALASIPRGYNEVLPITQIQKSAIHQMSMFHFSSCRRDEFPNIHHNTSKRKERGGDWRGQYHAVEIPHHLGGGGGGKLPKHFIRNSTRIPRVQYVNALVKYPEARSISY